MSRPEVESSFLADITFSEELAQLALSVSIEYALAPYPISVSLIYSFIFFGQFSLKYVRS